MAPFIAVVASRTSADASPCDTRSTRRALGGGGRCGGLGGAALARALEEVLRAELGAARGDGLGELDVRDGDGLAGGERPQRAEDDGAAVKRLHRRRRAIVVGESGERVEADADLLELLVAQRVVVDGEAREELQDCLLYTSDAADE